MEDLNQESDGYALDREDLHWKNISSLTKTAAAIPQWGVAISHSIAVYVQLYSVRLDSKWPRKFRYHNALYEG